MPDQRCRRAACLLILLAGVGDSAWAHHSFASVYDQDKPLRVQGVVEAIQWSNPHVMMTVVARDAEGAAIRWTFEMGAPGVLVNQFGWTRQTVQIGDTISIDGFRARTGDQQAAATSITTRDGRQLRAVRPFR